MMQQLVSHEADICLILQVTADRIDFVDFYHILASGGLILVSKKVDIATSFSLLQLLQIPVWISSVVCITIFFALATSIFYVDKFSGDNPKGRSTSLMFAIYGALVHQAIPVL